MSSQCDRLYLFDIDGTLIQSRGAGRYSFMAALENVLGKKVELTPKDLSGRTDLFIFRNAILRAGLEPSDSTLEKVTTEYLSILEKRVLESPPVILGGIQETLEAIAKRENCIGLLTGNLPDGARIKLGELYDLFDFGVYGNISEKREDLAIQARDLFEEKSGRKAKSMTLIGDTPFDIQAAHSAGAEAIAVTTGIYPAEDLGEAEVVFSSLLEYADYLNR